MSIECDCGGTPYTGHDEDCPSKRRTPAEPIPDRTGRGIAEEMCSTMMQVAELKLKMAKSKERVEAALEISGARELDVEAERSGEHPLWVEMQRLTRYRHSTSGMLAAPSGGFYSATDVQAMIAEFVAARSAAQSTAPVSTEQAGDAPRIPRENNDKLIELARYWKLDGDWMTCKGCKRSLIASRDGEELNHADGCKFAAQQHPWARLRALVAPSPNNSPVGANKEPKCSGQ